MGEKGNLLDMGEQVFENLAEQGPQFWLDYEQYKLSRAQSAQARVVVEQQATAVAKRDAAAKGGPAKFDWPPPPSNRVEGRASGRRRSPGAGGARSPRSPPERGTAPACPQ